MNSAQLTFRFIFHASDSLWSTRLPGRTFAVGSIHSLGRSPLAQKPKTIFPPPSSPFLCRSALKHRQASRYSHFSLLLHSTCHRLHNDVIALCWPKFASFGTSSIPGVPTCNRLDNAVNMLGNFCFTGTRC